MIDLRPYQSEAISSVLSYWNQGGGDPLVEMATGLGKSVVIAKLVQDLVEAYPTMRVLMLVHTRELVEQNAKQLMRLWPRAPMGIYSAGLGRRDAHHPITFASIQSVYRKAGILGPRDLVLIDECHLLPHEGEGMYRKLLADLRSVTPDLRVCGFTATPYRMDSGRLDKNGLFDKTVYAYGIARGIDDGWLSPIVSRGSKTEIDVSGVAKRGGEFIAGALEAAADKDSITQAACDEIETLGEMRRSWLIFCSGVSHAHHVRDALRSRGITAETVTGETPLGERDRIISAYKRGEIRALTNMSVLTTGFDAPNVDMIALLRPTLSPGLLVQMIGRGTRLASGKENCLILDFAGNIRRHGPIDTVMVEGKAGGPDDPEKVKVEDIRAKECPQCFYLAPIQARVCKHCDWVFVSDEPKHERKAETVAVLSRDLPKGPTALSVVNWEAKRWKKEGAPDSVRVTYHAGLQSISEWVCPEHGGYAGQKFEGFWLSMAGRSPVPRSVTDTLARWSELRQPTHIQVRPNGKFFDVVGRKHLAGVAA
jgi:DNA repair protein RadD